MVIKEWKCQEHGTFEATHAICPHLGCESEKIERVFLTAPGLKSDRTKFNDASFQKIADNNGFTDMSNKDGHFVGNRGNNPGAAIWGQSILNNHSLMSQAKAPLVITKKDGTQLSVSNNGLANAAGVVGKGLRASQVMAIKDVKADQKARETILSQANQ
jgi:hypothetical protein